MHSIDIVVVQDHQFAVLMRDCNPEVGLLYLAGGPGAVR